MTRNLLPPRCWLTITIGLLLWMLSLIIIIEHEVALSSWDHHYDRIPAHEQGTTPIPTTTITTTATRKSSSLHILLLTCNRPETLSLALESWAAVRSIQGVPFTVSRDCRDNESEAILRRFRQGGGNLSHIAVVDSFQIDTKEEGAQKLLTDERVSRHWLSAMNAMFARHGAAGGGEAQPDHVIYVEDDQVVSPDFLEAARVLISAASSLCADCFSLNMGCRGDCWGALSSDPLDVIRMESGNTGTIFSRRQWARAFGNESSQVGEAFCDMRGIWDENVHKLASLGRIPEYALTYLKPRIQHLTTCRSSRTHSGYNDDDGRAGQAPDWCALPAASGGGLRVRLERHAREQRTHGDVCRTSDGGFFCPVGCRHSAKAPFCTVDDHRSPAGPCRAIGAKPDPATVARKVRCSWDAEVARFMEKFQKEGEEVSEGGTSLVVDGGPSMSSLLHDRGVAHFKRSSTKIPRADAVTRERCRVAARAGLLRRSVRI